MLKNVYVWHLAVLYNTAYGGIFFFLDPLTSLSCIVAISNSEGFSGISSYFRVSLTANVEGGKQHAIRCRKSD